jgi:hypothetical protein
MYYQGTIHNGVVVFAGQPPLPEGAVVRVVPLPDQAPLPTKSQGIDPLFQMDELAEPTGLSDLAANADKYLNAPPDANHGG